MKRWKVATILLLCLALAGTVACSPFRGGGEEEETSQLFEVVRGDVTVSVSGSGNIAISKDANLTFGTSGKVDKIYVEEGDVVWQGRVLAELDTSALELALTEAEAAVKQAEASLEQAQANKRQAEANREQAEYNYKELKRQRIYGSRRTVAELELEAAELSLEAAELNIVAAQAQLVAAEQVVAEAQKDLSEAVITAPFAGVVAEVYVDEGDTVSATTTIVYLIDMTTMELIIELDEIDIPEVEVGQRAVIEVDALPELKLEGGVASIKFVPTMEGGVVLYEVEIDFAVPQDSRLRVGMSAEADIIIEERNAVLLVPAGTIERDSEGNPIVYVVVNEQIEARPVVIGISDGFHTEIVSGLKEGEMVVGRQLKAEQPRQRFRIGF